MNNTLLPIIWIGQETELTVEQALTHRGDAAQILGVLIGLPGTTLTLKTAVKHAAPATSSETLIHAILFDGAQIEYDGLVSMPAGVPGSSGTLHVRALTLGNQATISAVPRLEIIENNVSASHGVAVSRLDERQLFYLQSRSVGRSEAIALILHGFAEIILSRLNDPTTTRKVTRAIEAGLQSLSS